MEQLDMFEMDFDKIQRFFSHHKIVPEIGARYTALVKQCRIEDRQAVTAAKVHGNLIRYDNVGIALSNAWWVNDTAEGFADFVVFTLDEASSFVVYHEYDAEIGKPYRAELNRPDGDRPTSWMSCYFMGTTMAGRMVLVDFTNANNIVVLRPKEIKNLFPMSIATLDTSEGDA